jgi:hypothetical protein
MCSTSRQRLHSQDCTTSILHLPAIVRNANNTSALSGSFTSRPPAAGRRAVPRAPGPGRCSTPGAVGESPQINLCASPESDAATLPNKRTSPRRKTGTGCALLGYSAPEPETNDLWPGNRRKSLLDSSEPVPLSTLHRCISVGCAPSRPWRMLAPGPPSPWWCHPGTSSAAHRAPSPG